MTALINWRAKNCFYDHGAIRGRILNPFSLAGLRQRDLHDGVGIGPLHQACGAGWRNSTAGVIPWAEEFHGAV